ncbi:MAG: M48 family metallopeptidase [Eggerthellaceae bacterium]
MSFQDKKGRRKQTDFDEILDVDGISVVVKRKRIKNINLHVTPESEVVVSAPLTAEDELIAKLVRVKRSWIREKQVSIAASPMTRAEHATKEELAAWKAIVSTCVPPLMDEWESIMGVKHTSIVYRNMKSRWGSCQPDTGRICINIRLALYPPECLEYVVVHELCHLRERGHGPRFKALMDTYLPDWRERRAKLQ